MKRNVNDPHPHVSAKPFIGRAKVENIFQVLSLSAKDAETHLRPILGLRGAPVPPRVNPASISGGTLLELCGHAQDAILDAYRPLVDWAVSQYATTRDPILRHRLVEAGLEHRVRTADRLHAEMEGVGG